MGEKASAMELADWLRADATQLDDPKARAVIRERMEEAADELERQAVEVEFLTHGSL